jgi:L-amino acid N-acyltransferase YncA
MAFILRPASPKDVPSINTIHKYYVQNTVITFSLVPKTDDEALETYYTVTENGLPYIVAVDGKKIVGYCYASPFSKRQGWIYTLCRVVTVRSARGARKGHWQSVTGQVDRPDEESRK